MHMGPPSHTLLKNKTTGTDKRCTYGTVSFGRKRIVEIKLGGAMKEVAAEKDYLPSQLQEIRFSDIRGIRQQLWSLMPKPV